MRRSTKLQTALLVVAPTVVVAGCNATPIPQPPPENLDIGKIEFNVPEVTPASNEASFFGTPGAAPPNSRILVTNLDSTDPVMAIEVDEDGSFSASVPAMLEDELRFQVIVDGARLAPIDVRWTGTFEEPFRIDCFEVPLQLAFGVVALEDSAQAPLTLNNACGSAATVSVAAFRTANTAFGGTATVPTDLAAATASNATVSFVPNAAGEIETVLLITATVDGDVARYPVTLFGTGE